MICQSWKVMFQAEYSSGSPLRMLVDLRASVDHALGRGKAAEAGAKAASVAPTNPATAAKPGIAVRKTTPAVKAAAAAAGAAGSKPAAPASSSGEFEVSASSEWDPDAASGPAKK
jgi:hypothetical protein